MLLALAALGCSSSPTHLEETHLEDLEEPILRWDRSRGLCGSGFAVDADGEVWLDKGGCEDGRAALTSNGRSAPEKLEALRRAFEALPRDSGPDRTTCSGDLDSFSRTAEVDGFECRTCASGYGSELTGLEEPYLTVAKSFLALP
jgi:hypothetical protein